MAMEMEMEMEMEMAMAMAMTPPVLESEDAGAAMAETRRQTRTS